MSSRSGRRARPFMTALTPEDFEVLSRLASGVGQDPYGYAREVLEVWIAERRKDVAGGPCVSEVRDAREDSVHGGGGLQDWRSGPGHLSILPAD